MELTLLVMAAGLGRRFGGLKQLQGVGPHGETLMEYALYDAIRAQFDRAVFIVNEATESIFQDKLLVHFDRQIPCQTVVQRLTDLPAGCSSLIQRDKPWGTGHAVWSARKLIRGPFVVINADDYYGHTAFTALANYLRSHKAPREAAMLGYPLRNTLSEYGPVSRGICEVDVDGFLSKIVERTHLTSTPRGICDESKIDSASFLTGNEYTSLNCWGFQAGFLAQLEAQFKVFLEQQGNDPRAEFYLPYAVYEQIQRGLLLIKVLPTEEHWFGMTYREDQKRVHDAIHQRIDGGLYPYELWGGA